MIVNLTPHPLSLRRVDGTIADIPASGTVARVVSTDVIQGDLEGLALHHTVLHMSMVTDLPAPRPGVAYVASLLVAQAARAQGRTDVYAPGPAIRDQEGRIVGADGLSVP